MSRKQAYILIFTVFSLVVLLLTLSIDIDTDKKIKQTADINNNLYSTKQEMGITEIKEGNFNNQFNKVSEYIAEIVIGEFFYHINSKDFDSAYEMLDKDYIDLWNVNKGYFVGKHDYQNQKSYLIREVNEVGGRYIVKTDIFDTADIHSGKSLSRKVFSISNNSKLDDIGIKSITGMNTKEIRKNLSIEITKNIELENGFAYQLMITNLSETVQTIKSNIHGIFAVSPYDTYGHTLINGYEGSYVLQPGEEKKIVPIFSHSRQIYEIGIELTDGQILKLKT